MATSPFRPDRASAIVSTSAGPQSTDATQGRSAVGIGSAARSRPSSRSAASVRTAWSRAELAAGPTGAGAEVSGPSRAACSAVKRAAGMALTSTTAGSRPTRCRSWASSSMASVTGISSGRVTSTTEVRAGSTSHSCIQRTSLRSGPGGTMPSMAPGTRSSWMAWPVAGASMITWSQRGWPRLSARASWRILPSMTNSPNPGTTRRKWRTTRFSKTAS